MEERVRELERQAAEEAERQRLDTIKAAFTEAERQTIVEKTASLKFVSRCLNPFLSGQWF